MSYKLLVIDDQEDSRQLINAIFLDSDYEVVLCRSAREGYRRLIKDFNHIAAVLLDWEMPQISGIELLARIKSHDRYSLLPVIMLTGRDSPEDIKRGIKEGALYYVIKPVNIDHLKSLVQAATNQFKIIRNYQFKATELQSHLSMVSEASYYFRTMEQAVHLASQLSYLCADRQNAALGLNELCNNAIEHGNLEIDCEEKSALLRQGIYTHEISTRYHDNRFSNRRAHLTFKRDRENITFTITDEGRGFDFQKYLGLSPNRAFELNGRGIAIAKTMSFDSIEYIEPGNRVIATCRAAPAYF